MNSERLLELAAHVEQLPYRVIDRNEGREVRPEIDSPYNSARVRTTDPPPKFNMACFYFENCGCIAVHATYKWGDENDLDPKQGNYFSSVAARVLGIDDAVQARDLFYAAGRSGTLMREITPRMAAQALRLMASGEEVDKSWEIATNLIEDS